MSHRNLILNIEKTAVPTTPSNKPPNWARSATYLGQCIRKWGKSSTSPPSQSS